jgi:hypothetical protein
MVVMACDAVMGDGSKLVKLAVDFLNLQVRRLRRQSTGLWSGLWAVHGFV